MQACACLSVCVHVCKMSEAAVQANKQNGHKPQHKADHKPEHKPQPAAKKEEVHVGSSIGMSGRNPLDLIKTDAPLLSEAKTSKSKRALAPLLDAAGRDEACVWYRVRPMLSSLLRHRYFRQLQCFAINACGHPDGPFLKVHFLGSKATPK